MLVYPARIGSVHKRTSIQFIHIPSSPGDHPRLRFDHARCFPNNAQEFDNIWCACYGSALAWGFLPMMQFERRDVSFNDQLTAHGSSFISLRDLACSTIVQHSVDRLADQSTSSVLSLFGW